MIRTYCAPRADGAAISRHRAAAKMRCSQTERVAHRLLRGQHDAEHPDHAADDEQGEQEQQPARGEEPRRAADHAAAEQRETDEPEGDQRGQRHQDAEAAAAGEDQAETGQQGAQRGEPERPAHLTVVLGALPRLLVAPAAAGERIRPARLVPGVVRPLRGRRRRRLAHGSSFAGLGRHRVTVRLGWRTVDRRCCRGATADHRPAPSPAVSGEPSRCDPEHLRSVTEHDATSTCVVAGRSGLVGNPRRR